MGLGRWMLILGTAVIHASYGASGAEVVPTRFYLYTRQNPTAAQELTNSQSVASSNFQRTAETKIITHGFKSSTQSAWFKPLNAELLKRGDFNVINVDWGGSQGSDTFNYFKAATRTQSVGDSISRLVNMLVTSHAVDAKTIHIIGHSLGAHVAGYAGAGISGLGRITGLDPAGPGFFGVATSSRLDPTDATFVDIVHTTSGIGLSSQLGHADFYPNGDGDQPGCPDSVAAEGISTFISCSHSISIEYFTTSINTCKFKGKHCMNYFTFKSKLCGLTDLSGGNFNYMGFDATKPASGNLKYYLDTKAMAPYCIQ